MLFIGEKSTEEKVTSEMKASDQTSSPREHGASNKRNNIADGDLNGGGMNSTLLRQAFTNYETFYGLPEGCATLDMVNASSAGIQGWCNYDGGPALPGDSEPSNSNDSIKLFQTTSKEPKKEERYFKPGDEVEARQLREALLESMGVILCPSATLEVPSESGGSGSAGQLESINRKRSFDTRTASGQPPQKKQCQFQPPPKAKARTSDELESEREHLPATRPQLLLKNPYRKQQPMSLKQPTPLKMHATTDKAMQPKNAQTTPRQHQPLLKNPYLKKPKPFKMQRQPLINNPYLKQRQPRIISNPYLKQPKPLKMQINSDTMTQSKIAQNHPSRQPLLNNPYLKQPKPFKNACQTNGVVALKK